VIVVLLSAVAVAAAVLASRLAVTAIAGERLLRVSRGVARFGPLLAAIVSIGVVWYVWDAWSPIAKVHDETSYLLQADIFARGRWTVPSPPIPDFFEQPHVQVVPAVASKYPPGHALLLTPGALVGFPALMPLLLTGITAWLIVVLATRLANPWVGLTTWLIWLTAPIVLRFQPSYFSELTTTPLVLFSWWALLEWRETRRSRWLLLMALAIGWGAITRPLTMLAFAIPIGAVVLRDTVRLRQWRDFGLAFLVGFAVLSILPLWSAKTTGDWRVSPIELYRKDYLPFDKIGFTTDTTPPRRTVSPVLKTTYDYFRMARTEQTLDALPRIVGERAINLASALFQGYRLPLALFALVGLSVITAPLGFALISGVILFVAHLPYAHWAPWTVYYLEFTPVVAMLVATGLRAVLRRVTGDDRRIAAGVALVGLMIATFAVPSIRWWKRDHHGRASFDRSFAESLKRLPTPAIVFIQYSPRFAQHVAVVFNKADLDRAPIWVVHDLGARNADLRRLAPDRASFDFEEEQLVSQRR
jgi:4-amino-4-deoxy-L-arabinose transferase-like glycosyltransferase